MRRRKILFLHHPFVLGGSSVSLLYLLDQLDSTRYDPVVVCLHDAPEVTEYYTDHGYPTVVMHGRMFSHTTAGWWPLTNPLGFANLMRWSIQYRGASERLREIIRKVQPDIVHMNSLTLAPYARVSRAEGVPTVLHVRESVHPGHSGLRRRILAEMAERWCDEVIYISRDDQNRLTGPTRGRVIHNFVDFGEFDRSLNRDEARGRLGIGGTDKVLLYLGGISRIKGIIPLLRALPAIRDAVPSFVCLMPGAEFPRRWPGLGGLSRSIVSKLGWRSGEEEEARRLFLQGGMDCYVRMMPFSRDVSGLLAASDLVVFPSLEPHFARPVMEAAVMGRAVVASDVGGMREVVEPGVTGLLVPPGDSAALAAAVVRLLHDEEGSRRMGEVAYQSARDRFDAQLNAARTFEVYEDLCEGRVRMANLTNSE